MAAEYQHWVVALKSDTGAVDWNVSEGISGFYRIMAARTKPDAPLAIWPAADDKLAVKIGRRNPFYSDDAEYGDFIASTWPNCIAVTEEEYRTALTSGVWPRRANAPEGDERWDGTKPSRRDDSAPADDGRSNDPDPDASLADQIEALAERLNKTPEPTTQVAANKLSELLDRMRSLLKLAETERTQEKEPHLIAGREVDAKWSAITDPGKSAGIKAEDRRKAFLRKEQAKLDAAAAEENKRRLEEHRLAQEAAAGQTEEAAPPAPEPVVAEKAKAGSTHGRRTGLRKVRVGVVTDALAMVTYFVENSDVGFAAYLKDRAQAIARMPDNTRVMIPGIAVEEHDA